MGEKILTIAKVVFALVFVIVLAVLVSVIMGKMSSSTTKLTNTLEATDATTVDAYDDTTIKGSEVITVLNAGQSMGGDSKLAFIVNNKNTDADGLKCYGYGDFSDVASDECFEKDLSTAIPYAYHTTTKKGIATKADTYVQYNQTDSRKADYISTSASYKSTLLYNKNGALKGIIFVQQ